MANAIFRSIDYAPVNRDDEDDFESLLPPDNHYVTGSTAASPRTLSPRPPTTPRRQSSFAQNRADGTPRTPNRVRFEFEQSILSEDTDGLADSHWLDGPNSMNGNGHKANGRLFGQRAPLLTDMDAPSILLACEDDGEDADESDFNPEDLLETARPKSGMKSAFMNMANSIM